jgi:tetratricopeptide (TPR) repeat protein
MKMQDAGTARTKSMSMCLVSRARRPLAAFALGGLLTLTAFAQQSGTQNSSSTQGSKPTQQTPPAHKSAAQDNPFPADASQHAAQQQPQQGNSAPDTAQQPQSGQKPGEAAKDNPFPEDVSKSAAAAAAKENDAGTSSGNGVSSSSSNPGGEGNPDADIPPDTGRHRLKKPSDKDIESGSLAGEGRAQEDVRVGRFYLTDGNYKGAYGRFSEAVRMDPANVEAIYGLASAADGLHNKDEALANYKLYLQIAPDGDKAKSAQKAIRALAK